MVQIRTLEDIDLDTVAQAFAEAFSDYVRVRTADDYKKMLRRRGYVSELSFGAFEGDRLVSFTLNGIGSFDGKSTAYDSGTGTIKEYRGRKLAVRIFEAALPHLRQHGVEQYLLEVLQDNTAAISIYSAQGFAVSREFNYYVQQAGELTLNHRNLPQHITIRRTTLQPDLMQAMWDFTPSWQNSFDSINRAINEFAVIGAYDGDTLAGYGIIEPLGGDIAQLAVSKSYRRQGIATTLLAELVAISNTDRIQIINIQAAASSVVRFVQHAGFPLCGRQYEMMRTL